MVDYVSKSNCQKQENFSLSAEIGALIESYRKRAGISADHLAKLIGVESGELMLKYESGQLEIPLDVIFAASNELGIPPEEVVVLMQTSYVERFT